MFKQKISFVLNKKTPHRGVSTIVLIISVFSFVFFQYCYLKCEESGEGALMVLNEESFDFGDVEEGSVLTHVFNFKNCGDDTLRIRRVRGT